MLFTGGMMMLTGGATVVHHRPARIICLGSRTIQNNNSGDQLRDQLDQLQFEADNTRAKANKARQRLLRLSEAAEKLQRQAAICVQSGKENDARDLLYQKKKTMQTLEKTKSRIELLDELSKKLIEAISLRERQLVGTVALDLDTEKEEVDSPVRVVSPSSEDPQNDSSDTSDDQQLQDSKDNIPIEHETENQVPIKLSTHGIQSIDSNNNLASSLTGLTSYEDFLDHVDKKLNEIEDEVSTAVKFSTLILERDERPKNMKVQQLMEILGAVQHVRERIAVMMPTEQIYKLTGNGFDACSLIHKYKAAG
ncbi:hypothetical protein CTI12_AA255590 [Artemisia annua]|uniref:Uncharacterized protein n=1 Tax=Artemisia annua TaxID=35608 RepID=A0A2U1NKA2_ARTAN|nr:hypothetical protein CTI12_AA255590 [Artemisia annua]